MLDTYFIMFSIKIFSNLDLDKKKQYLKKINVTKDRSGNQCIYGIDNKSYHNYIKIGSTTSPERRKLDYKTYSPYVHKYLWVIYLEDFNCYLCDELLKYELEIYNIKDYGGTEFYNIDNVEIVRNILNRYEIFHILEMGDKYHNKIEMLNYNNNLLNTNANMNLDPGKFAELLNTLTPQQLAILNGNNNVEPESDIRNYKYRYVKDNLEDTKISENMENLVSKSQSLKFFVEKVEKNIKDILILGMIQSGKTGEIINMVYFCIRYLKIPVIIVIQNKTSAFLQIEKRIEDFSNALNDFNIRCSYVKTGLNKRNSLNIFDINNVSNNQVYICLSNYLQLGKIEDNLRNVMIHKKKLKPYALIMDEYDDLIKSRQDDIIKKKKPQFRIEPHVKYLKENSFINVGVTATLMALMLSEENITVDNIFSLTPGNLYVGFDSQRITINDISDLIQCKSKKTVLHNKNIVTIIDKIDKEVSYDIKEYCLTLINVTDNKSEHQKIYQRLRNDYDSWSHILFHSEKENKIICSLPSLKYSKIEYVEGYLNRDVDVEINLEKIRIPDDMIELLNKDTNMYIYLYTISFSNKTLQYIISTLFKYTDKISVISGRMACRGISFVDTDYKRHITDMIYVPSDNSHVTRNVQDMRIFGNFPNDGIQINLYMNKKIYLREIKNYIILQKELLSGNNSYDPNGDYQPPTLKSNIMNYAFDSERIITKKLDRNNLVKGFNFESQNSWGIPTNYSDIDKCINNLRRIYPDFRLKIMSLRYRMILMGTSPDKFVIPTLKNKKSNEYKKLVCDKLQECNSYIGKYNFKNLSEAEIKLFYIRQDYRNGWLLHNPVSIYNNINNTHKKSLNSICYLGKENSNYIDFIFKNSENHNNIKDNLGKKIIMVFWGVDSYHIFRCDRNISYIYDKFSE